MSTGVTSITTYTVGVCSDGYVFLEKDVLSGEAEHVNMTAGCYLEDADLRASFGLSEAVRNLDAVFDAVKEGEKFLHLHP